MQRRFEAEPVFVLVLKKILTLSSIMLLLGVAHADPPLFAGRIHAFGAIAFEDRPSGIGLFAIISKYEQHRSSLLERVFVDEYLVLGQPFR